MSTTSDDRAAWVQSKLCQLTLEEKADLLSGADVWRTKAIPRLHIPSLKMTDGPVGARGGTMVEGTTAALTPSAVALASAFDTELVQQIGHLLAQEVKTKKADILLAPTVCLNRHPLGGRNFESFSGEDPFLGGTLAAAYINAVQSHSIATNIKHFAANDQETLRFKINEIIDERTLHEIHLQPFYIAVRESQPWCLMSAYPRINSVYCSNAKWLLSDVLRDQWGWNGTIISDWFGVNSIVPAVEAGQDVEMPGPPRKRGWKLVKAVELGYVDEKTLDVSVTRVLELIYKTGRHLRPLKEEPEEAHDLPEHRALLRRAAAETHVLLKNDAHLLPVTVLPPSIAIIGPNSAQSLAAGGGSASLNPHYRQTPLGSFQERLGDEVKISHAVGCLIHKFIPLVPPTCIDPMTGEPGLHMDFFLNTSWSGKPIMSQHQASSFLQCYDNLTEDFTPGLRYSFRTVTHLTPNSSGDHIFSLASCGPSRLLVEGEEIITLMDRVEGSPRSDAFMGYGSPEERQSMSMKAGQRYEVIVECISREITEIPVDFTKELYRDEVMDGARLGFMEEEKRDLIAEAEELAGKVDTVVLLVGRSIEWETETCDIPSMTLPGPQDELVRRVLTANPKTIIVNQSGTQISMPWLDQASTIIQAWYQGQELGNALVDVITGHTAPSGKLPVTWPRRIEDMPAFKTWPGKDGVLEYKEEIFIGYRHFDKYNIKPLFPFGYGLSYTTFEYVDASISDTTFHGHVQVKITIKNAGKIAAKESLQVYVGQQNPIISRPVKELKGFMTARLNPNESKEVACTLDKYSLAYYDSQWKVDANSTYNIYIGTDCENIRAKFMLRVPEGQSW